MISLTGRKDYTVIPERELTYVTVVNNNDNSSNNNNNYSSSNNNSSSNSNNSNSNDIRNRNNYKCWTCANLSRTFFTFILTATFVNFLREKYRKPVRIYADEATFNVSMQTCIPGRFGDMYSQLPLTTWTPPGKDFSLPLYSTHNLNEIGFRKIHSAIIVQHGNLRNANDYFCGAVNSLLESNISPELMASTLVIAPYFPIQNDICWDKVTNLPRVIVDTVNCGYPLWSNEGWKDGHSSISPGVGSPIFSYDAFNILITHLGDNNNFPNLRNITVFGFSAGAQTVLRYAALPNYEIKNLRIKPRFIISDPSTYFYFDNKRPQKYVDLDGFTQIMFSIPNSSWITQQWQTDAIGMPWITNWDAQCAEYNYWRFGFENLTGYYASHFLSDAFTRAKIIAEFPSRDITYLVGTEDICNCKLTSYPGCTDNDLATYCPAMLQGNNRLDRILKWKMYLKSFYNDDNVHSVVFAEGVVHDPVQMIKSLQGKCTIFNICQNPKKFPGHGHDGDPGQVTYGGQKNTGTPSALPSEGLTFVPTTDWSSPVVTSIPTMSATESVTESVTESSSTEIPSALPSSISTEAMTITPTNDLSSSTVTPTIGATDSVTAAATVSETSTETETITATSTIIPTETETATATSTSIVRARQTAIARTASKDDVTSASTATTAVRGRSSTSTLKLTSSTTCSSSLSSAVAESVGATVADTVLETATTVATSATASVTASTLVDTVSLSTSCILTESNDSNQIAEATFSKPIRNKFENHLDNNKGNNLRNNLRNNYMSSQPNLIENENLSNNNDKNKNENSDYDNENHEIHYNDIIEKNYNSRDMWLKYTKIMDEKKYLY